MNKLIIKILNSVFNKIKISVEGFATITARLNILNSENHGMKITMFKKDSSVRYIEFIISIPMLLPPYQMLEGLYSLLWKDNRFKSLSNRKIIFTSGIFAKSGDEREIGRASCRERV